MILLWIGLALFCLFLCLMGWGVCSIAAESDRRTEAAFQEWLEGHPQQADGFLHQEVIINANGS